MMMFTFAHWNFPYLGTFVFYNKSCCAQCCFAQLSMCDTGDALFIYPVLQAMRWVFILRTTPDMYSVYYRLWDFVITGDALGIYPQNNPRHVQHILQTLGFCDYR
jgi:hypothetical protein